MSGNVQQLGVRTGLAVPLMREGAAIGAITIRRTEVRPFTDKQIALLKSFADQAVIAIENVRLFQELEARTRELARSIEELTALGEVGQAVSSVLTFRPFSKRLSPAPSSSLELIAESFMNTMRRKASFTSEPAIVWKRSWSKRFAQPRYILGRVILDKRHLPKLQFKWAISETSRDSPDEDSSYFGTTRLSIIADSTNPA